MNEKIFSGKDLENVYISLLGQNYRHNSSVENALWGLTRPINSQYSVVDISQKVSEAIAKKNWEDVPSVKFVLENNKFLTTMLLGLPENLYFSLHKTLIQHDIDITHSLLFSLSKDYRERDYASTSMLKELSPITELIRKKVFSLTDEQEVLQVLKKLIDYPDVAHIETLKVWLKEAIQNKDFSNRVLESAIKTINVYEKIDHLFIKEIYTFLKQIHGSETVDASLNNAMLCKVNAFRNNGITQLKTKSSFYKIDFNELKKTKNTDIVKINNDLNDLSFYLPTLLENIDDYIDVKIVKEKRNAEIYVLSNINGSGNTESVAEKIIEKILFSEKSNTNNLLEELKQIKETTLLENKLSHELEEKNTAIRHKI